MGRGSKMRTHIDISVIYLFLGVFLISAITLAFRYSSYTPCDDVLFTYETNTYADNELRAGSMIKFIDFTEGAQEWKWEFGDSTAGSSLKEPRHIFKDEGEYTVRLVVNNLCEREETITIGKREILRDSKKYPVFTLPEGIVVGETLEVKDETENASTWEWRFGETDKIDANSRRAEYVFEEPGLKTVSLIVNGDDDYITKKKIEVYPKKESAKRVDAIQEVESGLGWNVKKAPGDSRVEPTTGEIKPGAPLINESNFKLKIKLLSNEKITAHEFTEYFCGDLNKPILVNGKNTTFLALCEKIRGKKIRIKNLNIFRDKGSNCITTITIDYKRVLI